MDTLVELVHEAVLGYARKGLNSQSYFTHSDDNTIFSVVTVATNGTTFVSLLVRIVNSFVVIERDRNDKPLLDALLQAGIQRSAIILAYNGEPSPAIA